MRADTRKTGKMKKRILPLVMSLIMVLTLITVGSGPILAAERDTAAPLALGGQPNTNGELLVSVLSGGQWLEAGRLAYNQYLTDGKVSLNEFITPGQDIRVRVAKVSGCASHLDAVLLGDAAPAQAMGGGKRALDKLSAKDNDLIDVDENGVTLTFTAGARSAVLTVTARIEGENISKIPFQYPLTNLYRPMSEQASFYTYRLDSAPGSLNLDGEIEEAAGREPFFAEFSRTGSGHPAGSTYGWVMNDNENLYVALDFTSDNTMDGDKDYAKVYVNTTNGLKEFKISVPETTWGVPGFTYTDKVNYEHKVYEFKIPLRELGTPAEGDLQLAFAAYGTSSAPGPTNLTLAEAGSGRFLAVYTDYNYDGEGNTKICGCFVAANGVPSGAPFDVAAGFDPEWSLYALKVAYDGSRFLVVYEYGNKIYGRFVSSAGVAGESSFEISEGRDPVVASGGGKFLVACINNGDHKIYGRLVDDTGVVGESSFEISGGADNYYDLAMAYGDGKFLAAYQNGDDYQIYGRLIGDDGAVGAGSFSISEGGDGYYDPVVAYGGGAFLVAYRGDDEDFAYVYARRVTAGGSPEGDSLVLDASAHTETGAPSAAYGSGQGIFLVVWEAYLYDDETACILGRAVSPSGAIGERMELATAAPDTWFSAAAVAGGTGLLAGYTYNDSVKHYARFVPVAVNMVTPAIAGQPADRIAEEGEEAVFTVAAGALDGGILNYQWERCPAGGAWSPIPEATSPSYTIAGVTPADHGSSYRCVVSRADGAAAPVVSAAATLYVGVNAGNWPEFAAAIAGTTGIINITDSFALEDDVTISRGVTLTSGTGATITTGEHSLIVEDGGNVTIGGKLTVRQGNEPPIGAQALLVNGGTVAIGGKAKIQGSPLVNTTGVSVVHGEVNIGGNAFINAAIGVDVSGGMVNISGAAEIHGYNVGIAVSGGTVDIGGTAYIRGNQTGVEVTNGIVIIGGNANIDAYTGVDVSGGTVDIGGNANINAYTGVYVEGGTVAIGGNAHIDTNEVGVHLVGGTVNITVSRGLSVDGGVYGSDGSDDVAFLTALPAPVSMVLGHTETVTLTGVGAGVSFAIGTTPDTLGVTLGESPNTFTLTPTAVGVYDLALTATIGAGTLNLAVPVTVPPEAPVIGTQPADATAYAGNTVTFTITATSPDNGTLSYQWQKSTNGGTSWNNIAGATGASYTTGALALTDSGSRFRCAVTNTLNGTAAVTVSAEAVLTVNASSSGSGSSSGPQTAPTPSVGTSGNITAPTPQLNSSTGVAAVSIGAAALNTALSRAATDEGGKKTVAIAIPAATGATGYEISLPAGAITSAGTNTQFAINTDIASVTLPGNMLAGTAGAQNASLTVTQADLSALDRETRDQIGDRPVIQLSLVIDGVQTAWSNPDAPVTVSIPYTPTAEELNNPEHIVVWYIDGSGNTVSVPNGRYDPATGTVTFSTTHFSHYAVAYVQKTFGDLGAVEWARKPIEVMASKGIINGTSGAAYSPSASITRADYLILLIKTLGLTADFADNFADVEPGAYYYEAAGVAKKLGIAGGVGNNRFYPQDNISRQDMMVMTARALEKFKGLKITNDLTVLDSFDDKGDIAGYATGSMAGLVKAGFVAGSGGELNARAQTTRAEAAVFLYRIYNAY